MLFSSHILEEVEQVARQIEVVVAGRHAASRRLPRIRRLMTDRRTASCCAPRDDRRLAVGADRRPVVRGIQLAGGGRAARSRPSTSAGSPSCCPRLAREHGIRLLEVSPSDESLESVFSYLVAA